MHRKVASITAYDLPMDTLTQQNHTVTKSGENLRSYRCFFISSGWQSLLWHLFVLTVILFFSNLVSSGTTMFIPLSMGTNYDYAGILTSCIAFGSTIVGPGAAYVISVTSSEFGFVLSFILRIISLTLMYSSTIDSNSNNTAFIIWFIACGIFGISLAFLNIGLSDYCSIYVTDDSKRGKFLSYLMFVCRMAYMVGPFMNGFISDRFGSNNNNNNTNNNRIECMLILNSSLTIIGLIMTFFLLIPPKFIIRKNRYRIENENINSINNSNGNGNGIIKVKNYNSNINHVEINSFSQFWDIFETIGWQRFNPAYWINNIHDNNNTININSNTNGDDNICAGEEEAFLADKSREKLSIDNIDDRSSTPLSVTKYVCLNYGRLIIVIGILGFGLEYARRTRELVLVFESQSLNLSDSEIGIINTLSHTPGLILFLVAGYMMDKYGRKSTGIPSLVIFIIGLIFVPFAQTFKQLVMVSLIFGIADGISIGLLITMTTDVAPNEDNHNYNYNYNHNHNHNDNQMHNNCNVSVARHIKGSRAQFLALIRTSWSSAEMISPVIVGYLSSNVSIFYACLSTAIVTALSLFWVIFFVPETINYTNNITSNVMIIELQRNKLLNESD